MKTIFALIDCNNFFVSCERLFRPDLTGKPVVVLSSNDGCVVSRSNEAKALGIPMGAPAFKYRHLFKQRGVVRFSANFELYGDISERITRLLTGITPRTEVYSVDEAFLDLSQLDIKDYQLWGTTIQRRILQEVGIPVSLGIAASKTLAKLAAERGKKDAELNGVLDLYGLPAKSRELYLLKTPVKDIWGVGWRLSPKLKAEGIYNALDLAQSRPRRAQQLMGVHGRQMVTELGGVSCHALEIAGKVRQQVMKGRQFGHDIDSPAAIEAAIATLTARAAFVLRREGLQASRASVHLSTNRHKPGYIRRFKTIELATPTADTGLLTAKLIAAIADCLAPGRLYHRADVLMQGLVDENRLQPDLFGEVNVPGAEASHNRLAAVDAINRRYGKDKIYYAAEGLSDAWQPKHGSRSPRYTTNWEELPIANIVAKPGDASRLVQ
jgi:DNA polymerase V